MTIFFFCTAPSPLQHPCTRDCEYPPENRICDFGVFNVEWFIGGNSDLCKGCLLPYDMLNGTYSGVHEFNQTECPECLLLDGFPRNVAVVNRIVPGPTIEVICQSNLILRFHGQLETDIEQLNVLSI